MVNEGIFIKVVFLAHYPWSKGGIKGKKTKSRKNIWLEKIKAVYLQLHSVAEAPQGAEWRVQSL